MTENEKISELRYCVETEDKFVHVLSKLEILYALSMRQTIVSLKTSDVFSVDTKGVSIQKNGVPWQTLADGVNNLLTNSRVWGTFINRTELDNLEHNKKAAQEEYDTLTQQLKEQTQLTKELSQRQVNARDRLEMLNGNV